MDARMPDEDAAGQCVPAPPTISTAAQGQLESAGAWVFGDGPRRGEAATCPTANPLAPTISTPWCCWT